MKDFRQQAEELARFIDDELSKLESGKTGTKFIPAHGLVEIESALRQAYESGRNDGMEEAAKIVEFEEDRLWGENNISKYVRAAKEGVK